MKNKFVNENYNILNTKLILINMKVFPEYFEFNQFEMARENMHTIKRPYINFGLTINFKF